MPCGSKLFRAVVEIRVVRTFHLPNLIRFIQAFFFRYILSHLSNHWALTITLTTRWAVVECNRQHRPKHVTRNSLWQLVWLRRLCCGLMVFIFLYIFEPRLDRWKAPYTMAKKVQEWVSKALKPKPKEGEGLWQSAVEWYKWRVTYNPPKRVTIV